MATIKDIAKEIGVSKMTISRAFNKPDEVSPELRDRIMSVADRLEYSPNQAARSLASKKTGIIQLVSSIDSKDFFFCQLLSGATQHLSECGYSIMINTRSSLNFDCDGAIFMGLAYGEDKTIMSSFKKAKVLLGKTTELVDCVEIDNFAGINEVTNLLINRGHKKIGYVGLDSVELYILDRLEGYETAMKNAGITILPGNIQRVENTLEAVNRNGANILKAMDITALVCGTDQIAFGLIKVLQEQGVRVPEDVSVVGFDGLIYHEMSVPKITTAKQPVYEIGVELAKVLLNRIKHPDSENTKKVIPLEVIEGQSVKSIN